MKKQLTPKDLDCFQGVADIIGDERAEEELQKVIDAGVEVNSNEIQVHDAFIWNESPQRYDFWASIYAGVLPDEYENFVVESDLTDERVDTALQNTAHPSQPPVNGDNDTQEATLEAVWMLSIKDAMKVSEKFDVLFTVASDGLTADYCDNQYKLNNQQDLDNWLNAIQHLARLEEK